MLTIFKDQLLKEQTLDSLEIDTIKYIYLKDDLIAIDPQKPLLKQLDGISKLNGIKIIDFIHLYNDLKNKQNLKQLNCEKEVQIVDFKQSSYIQPSKNRSPLKCQSQSELYNTNIFQAQLIESQCESSINSSSFFEQTPTCKKCFCPINIASVSLSCYCFYHTYCFRDMCKEQLQENKNILYCCFCKSKVNLQVLKLIEEDGEKIYEDILKNQLEELKIKMQYNYSIERCSNCAFFIIVMDRANLQDHSCVDWNDINQN